MTDATAAAMDTQRLRIILMIERVGAKEWARQKKIHPKMAPLSPKARTTSADSDTICRVTTDGTESTTCVGKTTHLRRGDDVDHGPVDE